MENKIEKFFSENIAEIAADAFLNKHFGLNIFIGADIESLISEWAQVIYQDIDDPTYSGAAVSYRHQNFVVLNTCQSLRARYYSAAHELWHLALSQALFGSESKKVAEQVQLPLFDSERAADHFAAAVMMPKSVMMATWSKYVDQRDSPDKQQMQMAVVRIANVSSMPYVAVARRLRELGLLSSQTLMKLSETDWVTYVETSGFPPSPLDGAIRFKQFTALSQLVDQLVTKKQLTLMEAANLLAHSDPKLAEELLKERQAQVDQISEESK